MGDVIKEREQAADPTAHRDQPSRVENEERDDLMATIPTTLSEPILVANLPLPPDVAEDVERICRSNRLVRKERARFEQDIKLSHHYAGHFVVATAGTRGLEIHAIDLDDPDEIHELTKRLRAQGHRHVLSLYPTPWRVPYSLC